VAIRVPTDQDLPALTPDLIDTFAHHLKSSVQLYFKLSTPAQSDWTEKEKIELERIGRLRGHSPIPLLVALYRKESNVDKRV